MSWSRVAGSINSFFVAAYKVLGFAILTGILLTVASYFVTQGLGLLNKRWIAPTVVSASDERILQLQTQIAQESAAYDHLKSERAELEVRLRDTERTIASQEHLLGRMREGLQNDLASVAQEQQRLGALAGSFRRSRRRISSAHDAYAEMSSRRVHELLASKLSV